MDKLPKKTGSLNYDYRKIFNTEEGKRVLRDLMVECHIFDGMRGNIPANELFFGEGQRNVAIYILNRLQEPHDPDRYRQQQKQASVDFSQRLT